MKAIIIDKFVSTLDQIQVSEIPKPRQTTKEILVKVEAAGVNFVDTLYARGKHQNNRSLVRPPFPLGLEFAGTVVSAPPNSTFQAGDQVFGDCLGSYSEFITLPADSPSIYKIPSSWGPTDAAGLAATLPVSYGALVLSGKLTANDTVLIHSAAGGLGVMAVQIAAAKGCTVLGTAGSAAKCQYAESFGATQCFDYSRPDWPQRVLDATGGKGADLVFDPVGLVSTSMKCTAHRGRILVVGFASREGNLEHVAMNRVLLKQISLIGYRYGESLRRHPEEKNRIWRDLFKFIEQGKIRPPAPQCYEGLEKVPQALADLANRKVLGKAVVRVGGQSSLIRGGSEPKL